jgi:hypothetical protein
MNFSKNENYSTLMYEKLKWFNTHSSTLRINCGWFPGKSNFKFTNNLLARTMKNDKKFTKNRSIDETMKRWIDLFFENQFFLMVKQSKIGRKTKICFQVHFLRFSFDHFKSHRKWEGENLKSWHDVMRKI